ncbi:MAG: TolC family protein [Candidatus Omnitrophota bacterium]
MVIKKILLPILSVLLLVVQPVFAEAPVLAEKVCIEKLTFLDYYQKVLAHYPALKKRYEKLEQAKANRNLAIADLFPHIQGVFSTTATNDPVGVFGDLLRQQKFTQNDFSLESLNRPDARTNYHAGIEGEMLLFDSFNTISKIRSARRMVKSADLEADFTEMEAGIVALESYLGILLAQEVFDSVSSIKSASDKDLQQAEDLNQKGMILGADFYAARVVAASIEREHNRSKSLLKSSRMLMNILMGEDPGLAWNPVGKLPEIKREAVDLRVLFSQSYQQRKDLAALDQMVDAARIESLRQKTSFLPKFYGFGSLNEDANTWRSGGENFTVGFRGTMDFFDPTYLGRIQGAKHQYEELKVDRQALRDEIVKDLILELNRYETATEDHSVLKQAAQDAQQASEQTAKLYQEGRKSIADLLEMRRSYLETVSGFQGLLMALELEYAKLLFLSGQLTENGIHEMNTRLKG